MGKFYMFFMAFMIISCEEEEILVPKTAARKVEDKAVVKEVEDKIVVKEVEDKAVVKEVEDKAVVREVEDKAVVREVASSSGTTIDKAKETEAFLQKQVDSIIRQFDSLGVPK